MIKLFEQFTIEQRQHMIVGELTYIKKNIMFEPNMMNDIRNKIKNYDINNFKCRIETYEVVVYPDDGFKNLLVELNKTLENKIDIIRFFDLSVDQYRLNTINIDFNLPEILRGLNIGYKIYKMMTDKLNYITSEYGSSPEARNIWYKLIVDENYYAFTSKITSGVIKKDILEEKLKEILIKIKNDVYKIYGEKFENIIFDDELKTKIEQWKL